MSAQVTEVSKRIRREISELYRIKELALRRWQKALRDEDYLGSVAFDLQGFYRGVERVFETIAKTIDRAVPEGEQWHKMLLKQMANEIPGIRPAVVSKETRGALDHFRMFRHLAHNVYTFNLIPERIEVLVEKLPGAVDLVCGDFSIFSDFLEQRNDRIHQ